MDDAVMVKVEEEEEEVKEREGGKTGGIGRGGDGENW